MSEEAVETNDKIRNVVLDFVKKKKAELQAKGREWLGWYHNGGFGSYPSRQVIITNGPEGSFNVEYRCNSQFWEYNFKPQELN